MSYAEARAGAEAPATPAMWWRGCPNTPPCPHFGIDHDIYDDADPRPRCCVDGCPCGQQHGPDPV